LTDGRASTDIHLSANGDSIYIPRLIWTVLSSFSPDATLLVLASEHYHESDYIKNYAEFLEISNQ